MAAVPQLVAEVLEQAEYLVTASRGDHYLTGVEGTLERALFIARGLAMTGWKVRVQSANAHDHECVVMDVWAEQ